jgi:hypothetical protein
MSKATFDLKTHHHYHKHQAELSILSSSLLHDAEKWA